MLYGWGTLCLFSDVFFSINVLGLQYSLLFFALWTVFSGFIVLQPFQVSQKLSVCFQSQRPFFF